MTRTLLAGVCSLHGQHDGHRCPACAQLADVPAIRECLHMHSRRIDQAHDAAMSVADQVADLHAYAASLAALIRAQAAQIAELTNRLHDHITREREPRFLLVQPASFGTWCQACELYTTSDRPGVKCSACGK